MLRLNLAIARMTDLRLALGILALILVASALASAQAPPFAFVKDQIPAEAGPVLGLADFDQDGDLDLLTNYTGIYLNDGHGNFTPHPVPSAISAGLGNAGIGFGEPVAIGDVNGDGVPDVLSYDVGAFTNVGPRKWINQGNGVLISSPLTAAGPGGTFGTGYPRVSALGDVDGDGDNDVVFSFAIPPSCGIGGTFYPPLVLWLNNGGGTFVDASPQLPAQSMNPTQIALADMDNDGDLDLVCGGECWGTMAAPLGPQIFLNGGGGVFSQTPIVLFTPWNYDAFSIGDVDGDGFKDLVLSASPRLNDCVPVGAPIVCRNPGVGGSATFPATAAGAARCVTLLFDANGNGTDDLVVLTYASSAIHAVYSNAVAPAMASVPAAVSPYLLPSQYFMAGAMSSINHAAAGDLDGDGDRDLVLFTAQGNRALFNDSIGHLVAAPASLETPFGWNGPGAADPADIDGDGDLDLLLGGPICFVGNTATQSTVSVALNDGTGSLTSGPPMSCVGCSIGGPRAFFDADHDGDSDVCVASATTQVLTPTGWTSSLLAHVLINSGGGLAIAQTLTLGTITGGSYPTAVRAADLDGDGDLDVVVAGTTTAVLLNDGTGTLQLAATLAPGGSLALADVDSDADVDVVMGGSPCKLLLNGGNASFVQSPGLPSINASSIVAADFDGDGDLDLLLDHLRFANDGSGWFTAAGGIPSPSAYPGLWAAFDVDLDGLPDVVNSNGFLYRNLGGAFAAAITLTVPLMYPVVHADFDRDGDDDLVARGPSILTNMTRQLSRGKPPRPGRPASLELAGPPGAPWLLFASYGTGNLTVPGLGTVLLDLSTTQFTHGGAFSPTGTATVSGTVPAGPMWVGTSVFWQAMVYHPQGARLTGLEVTTIANY